jgi:hypothetical protein
LCIEQRTLLVMRVSEIEIKNTSLSESVRETLLVYKV